jgi:hypothetical protein
MDKLKTREGRTPPSTGLKNSESLLQPIAPVLHPVDRTVTSVSALVLAIVRATIRAFSDTVTPLFPEFNAVFDTIADIFTTIAPALLS